MLARITRTLKKIIGMEDIKNFSASFFTELPPELKTAIFSLLNSEDLHRAAQTNKINAEIINEICQSRVKSLFNTSAPRHLTSRAYYQILSREYNRVLAYMLDRPPFMRDYGPVTLKGYFSSIINYALTLNIRYLDFYNWFQSYENKLDRPKEQKAYILKQVNSYLLKAVLETNSNYLLMAILDKQSNLVNTCSINGVSLLNYAISKMDYGLTAEFIKRGAYINRSSALDPFTKEYYAAPSPLGLALELVKREKKYVPAGKKIIALLLKQGADPDMDSINIVSTPRSFCSYYTHPIMLLFNEVDRKVAYAPSSSQRAKKIRSNSIRLDEEKQARHDLAIRLFEGRKHHKVCGLGDFIKKSRANG